MKSLKNIIIENLIDLPFLLQKEYISESLLKSKHYGTVSFHCPRTFYMKSVYIYKHPVIQNAFILFKKKIWETDTNNFLVIEDKKNLIYYIDNFISSQKRHYIMTNGDNHFNFLLYPERYTINAINVIFTIQNSISTVPHFNNNISVNLLNKNYEHYQLQKITQFLNLLSNFSCN
jgi:hypothetical protein